MQRIIARLNYLQNKVDNRFLPGEKREELQKDLYSLKELGEEVKAELNESFLKFNERIKELESEIGRINNDNEELRRTREEYRVYYEKRIEEKDKEIKDLKQEVHELVHQNDDLEELVILQARFISK